LEAVEVTWVYDELFTLLLLQDKGLDLDLDGVLTPDEQTQLDGFDMNWIEGYQGDLYLYRGQTPLTLGPPIPVTTALDGETIVTTHRRAVTGPAHGVVVQAYDPTFYTAYSLSRGVEVSGTCGATIEPANLDRAYAALEEMLFAQPERDFENDFPEVGAKFADTVTLQC